MNLRNSLYPQYHMEDQSGRAPAGAKAIFSTNNGEREPQDKNPGISAILRSDPEAACDQMAGTYQTKYPEICLTITHPIVTADLHDFFDGSDIQRHGWQFLIKVLRKIATRNADRIADLEARLNGFADVWINVNVKASPNLIKSKKNTADSIRQLFTESDEQIYGPEFLNSAAALVQTKLLKIFNRCRFALHIKPHMLMVLLANIDHEEDTMRLQQEYDQVYSISPRIQVELNADLVSTRHDQITSSRGPLPPLQQMQGVAQEYGDTYGTPEHYDMGPTRPYNPEAVYYFPAEGYPQPILYQQQPRRNQMASATALQSASNSSVQRGRKNPSKGLSDDARKVSRGSDSSRPSVNHGPIGNEHWQQGRTPEQYNSNISMQIPVYASHYSGQSSNLHPNYQRNNTSAYPPHIENMRHPTHPHSISQRHPNTKYLTQYPPPMIEQNSLYPGRASSTNVPARPIFAKNQTPVGSNAFGNRLPGTQSRSSGRSEFDMSPRRSVPALVQSAGRGGTHRAAENTRKGAETSAIRIGGFPNDVSEAAIWELLRQCVGFLRFEIVSKSNGIESPYSWCFAYFQDPHCAQDAIHQIPRLNVNWMQGRNLEANWSRQKDNGPSFPEYHNSSNTRQSTQNASATDPRQISSNAGQLGELCLEDHTTGQQKEATAENNIRSVEGSNDGATTDIAKAQADHPRPSTNSMVFQSGDPVSKPMDVLASHDSKQVGRGSNISDLRTVNELPDFSNKTAPLQQHASIADVSTSDDNLQNQGRPLMVDGVQDIEPPPDHDLPKGVQNQSYSSKRFSLPGDSNSQIPSEIKETARIVPVKEKGAASAGAEAGARAGDGGAGTAKDLAATEDKRHEVNQVAKKVNINKNSHLV